MNLNLSLHNRTITTELSSFVMGILNVTPDSLYPKSQAHSIAEALEIAQTMILEGADIIDIGGESTRPGAVYISEEEELERVIPVIQKIREFSDIPISIDTRRYQVMKIAFEQGADICNDISALEDDPLLASFIASTQVPIILMHKKGIPKTMQLNPSYKNVVLEVNDYLLRRAQYAMDMGIAQNKIIIDPGIGFGKDLPDNKAIIKELSQFVQLGFPVLMGLSHKNCIGLITNKDVALRNAGTLAAHMLAAQRGSSILRVHNVGDTIDMLKILKELG